MTAVPPQRAAMPGSETGLKCSLILTALQALRVKVEFLELEIQA